MGSGMTRLPARGVQQRVAPARRSGERCNTGGGSRIQVINLWMLRKLFGLTGILSMTARAMDGLSVQLCEVVEQLTLRNGLTVEDIAPLS